MTATGNPALDAGEESLQDRELLAALRAGEDAAFGELFSRHADAVRRLARSLATDRADAEDLTAEAFFRVLQAIRRGAGPVDNVRSYLLIVTRRVAWEWSERRRDVPVADEVLSHRAGQNPDTAGQTHERNLITRAFTSLPERWRSVLWKVEVEGERPAVVAINFGLSANATAALARRARRGLRAAYLQAHLSTHHGSNACRSILEKLGAYTAGTIKGAERRRVRAHLVSCTSCQSTHDELRDVCAGLRSYAGLMAAPVALGGLWAQKAGFWSTLKGLVSGAGAKLTIAASSVVAAGVIGMVAGPSTPDGDQLAGVDFNGRGGAELAITESEMTHQPPVTGSISSSVRSTEQAKRTGQAVPVVRHQDQVPEEASAPTETAAVLRGIQSGPVGDPITTEERTIAEETTVLLGPPEETKDTTCAEETETTKPPVKTPETTPEPPAEQTQTPAIQTSSSTASPSATTPK